MLVLNGRDPNKLLFAKDALLFVRTSDLAGGKLKAGRTGGALNSQSCCGRMD